MTAAINATTHSRFTWRSPLPPRRRAGNGHSVPRSCGPTPPGRESHPRPPAARAPPRASVCAGCGTHHPLGDLRHGPGSSGAPVDTFAALGPDLSLHLALQLGAQAFDVLQAPFEVGDGDVLHPLALVLAERHLHRDHTTSIPLRWCRIPGWRRWRTGAGTPCHRCGTPPLPAPN